MSDEQNKEEKKPCTNPAPSDDLRWVPIPNEALEHWQNGNVGVMISPGPGEYYYASREEYEEAVMSGKHPNNEWVDGEDPDENNTELKKTKKKLRKTIKKRECKIRIFKKKRDDNEDEHRRNRVCYFT
ncbi:WW domain-containing protein [Caenorhabditis elegans]|uniref:WW domain-containing protein n=1 Tax=Caenorhabditis elegans TaxID=6239 RepID=Q21462_CAEEL|nr:WW domain-containing protein [Caenorhabditis elegans]CCD68792.1 WW domain-containing protein [Caenorhabditis elegans]|eukprot:NP_509482.2 Uncharacterized protein CELE_M02D8.2 [Caenorhabditis elegans]